MKGTCSLEGQSCFFSQFIYLFRYCLSTSLLLAFMKQTLHMFHPFIRPSIGALICFLIAFICDLHVCV